MRNTKKITQNLIENITKDIFIFFFICYILKTSTGITFNFDNTMLCMLVMSQSQLAHAWLTRFATTINTTVKITLLNKASSEKNNREGEFFDPSEPLDFCIYSISPSALEYALKRSPFNNYPRLLLSVISYASITYILSHDLALLITTALAGSMITLYVKKNEAINFLEENIRKYTVILIENTMSERHVDQVPEAPAIQNISGLITLIQQCSHCILTSYLNAMQIKDPQTLSTALLQINIPTLLTAIRNEARAQITDLFDYLGIPLRITNAIFHQNSDGETFYSATANVTLTAIINFIATHNIPHVENILAAAMQAPDAPPLRQTLHDAVHQTALSLTSMLNIAHGEELVNTALQQDEDSGNFSEAFLNTLEYYMPGVSHMFHHTITDTHSTQKRFIRNTILLAIAIALLLEAAILIPLAVIYTITLTQLSQILLCNCIILPSIALVAYWCTPAIIPPVCYSTMPQQSANMLRSANIEIKPQPSFLSRFNPINWFSSTNDKTNCQELNSGHLQARQRN